MYRLQQAGTELHNRKCIIKFHKEYLAWVKRTGNGKDTKEAQETIAANGAKIKALKLKIKSIKKER